MNEHSDISRRRWVVVDASVMSKWFFVGEVSNRATDLLERLQRQEIVIAIPTLAIYEFATLMQESGVSVARFRSSIQEIYTLISNSDILLVIPSPQHLSQSYAISHEVEASVSASIYALIAKQLGADFITANAGRYQNFQGLSPTKRGFSLTVL